MVTGQFEMASVAKMSLAFWLTVLLPSLIVVTQKLIVDYTHGMLALFIFNCFMKG